jgi:hypothetical protein
MQRLRAREDAIEQVTRGVVAGQLDLRQAAAALRDIDARLPSGRPPRDAEAYCREVIHWVRPSQITRVQPDLATLLEAELDELLRDGLELPPAGP